jgi:hypothetical protein
MAQPWISCFSPGSSYFVILAGWVNRQQQEVTEYLRTENQVLKEKFGKKRSLLNDDQRRRLGNKIIAPGVEVGRREGEIKCRERLGGLLRHYYRGAA